jgi:hypothetical protein
LLSEDNESCAGKTGHCQGREEKRPSSIHACLQGKSCGVELATGPLAAKDGYALHQL